MHPLDRLMGAFAHGMDFARRWKPRWRSPHITDAGKVSRQQLRQLDRKQPELATAIREISNPRLIYGENWGAF